MKLKFIVAGLLAGAAFSASAADQTLSGLTVGTAFNFVGTPTLFADAGSDTLTFTGLAAGTYEALLSYSGTNTKITAASLNGQAPDYLFASNKVSLGSFDVTATSPFTLTLTGAVYGKPSAASYSGQLTIMAVPEPETYGMLLAGLGLLGVVARRKAKKAA